MLPFPHTLTLMETTWGTQDTGKITGKGKAMQTISHWADGMKAWQLLHTSLLPGSPSGPSFPKHKLHLLSLIWGGKSVRTQEERHKRQLGSPAPNPSPARGNLPPSNPQWNTVIAITRHSSRHSFSHVLKKPQTKNNNKKDQKKIISSNFPKQLSFKQTPSLKHFSKKADV